MQIATECDLMWNQVNNVVKIEKITPAKTIGRRKFFDIYQEDIIHRVLYFTGLLTELTLESKINRVESKEEKYQAFREFKLKTYTR